MTAAKAKTATPPPDEIIIDLQKMTKAEQQAFYRGIITHLTNDDMERLSAPVEKILLEKLDKELTKRAKRVKLDGEQVQQAIENAVASLSDEQIAEVFNKMDGRLLQEVLDSEEFKKEVSKAKKQARKQIANVEGDFYVKPRPKKDDGMFKAGWDDFALDVKGYCDRPLGSYARVVPAAIIGYIGWRAASGLWLDRTGWAGHWAADAAAPVIAIILAEAMAAIVRNWDSGDEDEDEDKKPKKGKKSKKSDEDDD